VSVVLPDGYCHGDRDLLNAHSLNGEQKTAFLSMALFFVIYKNIEKQIFKSANILDKQA
jgi:hypothetical protein